MLLLAIALKVMILGLTLRAQRLGRVPPPLSDREARKLWPVGHAQVAGAGL